MDREKKLRVVHPNSNGMELHLFLALVELELFHPKPYHNEPTNHIALEHM